MDSVVYQNQYNYDTEEGIKKILIKFKTITMDRYNGNSDASNIYLDINVTIKKLNNIQSFIIQKMIETEFEGELEICLILNKTAEEVKIMIEEAIKEMFRLLNMGEVNGR